MHGALGRVQLAATFERQGGFRQCPISHNAPEYCGSQANAVVIGSRARLRGVGTSSLAPGRMNASAGRPQCG